MSIEITDTHICEGCGKPFSWNFFEPERQKMESNFHSEPIPVEKTLAHAYHKSVSGNYDVEVNCPECGIDNRFTYPDML